MGKALIRTAQFAPRSRCEREGKMSEVENLEKLRAQLCRKNRGSKILVDHRVHSFETESGIAINRDATAAASDNERVTLEQSPDRRELMDRPLKQE